MFFLLKTSCHISRSVLLVVLSYAQVLLYIFRTAINKLLILTGVFLAHQYFRTYLHHKSGMHILKEGRKDFKCGSENKAGQQVGLNRTDKSQSL